MHKTCTRCLRDFPATSDYFFRLARNPDGLRNQCKWCLGNQHAKPTPPPAEPITVSAQKPLGRAGSPAPRRSPKTRSILLLPDLHVPDHDQRVWGAVVHGWLPRHPVDEVILMGDFLELASCSQHPGTDFMTLLEDFSAGKAALKELRTACPTAQITLLEGNHETRLKRITAAKLPQAAGSLTIREGLDLDEIGAVWVPEDQQPVTRGDMDVTHGHQTLGEGFGAKYHAVKMVDTYGEPGHTVVYGHTHKHQAYLKPSKRGNQLGLGLGCLRTLRPDWLHGREAGWCHQFGVAYVRPNGHTDVVVVTVTDGAFIWDGELYE